MAAIILVYLNFNRIRAVMLVLNLNFAASYDTQKTRLGVHISGHAMFGV